MRFRKKINWFVCLEPLLDGIDNTDNNVKLGNKKAYCERVVSLVIFS